MRKLLLVLIGFIAIFTLINNLEESVSSAETRTIRSSSLEAAELTSPREARIELQIDRQNN